MSSTTPIPSPPLHARTLPSRGIPYTPPSTSTPKIPILFPEIWLLVFPYLKTTDLRSVSLTCAAFRSMAQPLIFAVLDVSPFLLSYNAEQPTFRPGPYFDRLQERLKHYALPHIVHGVRSCWISPYTRSGFPPRDQLNDLRPDFVIDAVLEVLPLFPNLTSLSWHCIDITPKWWNIIQSLHLQKLWLNSSTVPLSVTSSLHSVTHLDLDQWPWEGRVTNHVSIHEERSPGVGERALRHVIHPETILSISVPRADTSSYLFLLLSQTTYSLRTLKVPFSSFSDPNFTIALEHCPHLEVLCVFPPSSGERLRDIELYLPTSSLPSLKTYEGPCSHAVQISRKTLQNVSLWGLDDPPAVCSPRGLAGILAELAETSTRNSLRCLKVTVMDITPDLLDVFSLFSSLESIIIQSQDSTPRDMSLSLSRRSSSAITSLYAMMTHTCFPPNVRHVKLLTRLPSPKLDIAGQEHEAACFTESLALHNPKLERIEVGYGIYWTGIYSAIWGRLRDNTENLKSSVDDTSPNEVDGGYSSESSSSSRDYIFSTVVSSVHPLPMGKLMFTEHRRTILFANDAPETSTARKEASDQVGRGHFFTSLWVRARRLFGQG